VMEDRAQNSMLLVLSPDPASSQIFLGQQWLKEALDDVFLKSHMVRGAAGSVVSLQSRARGRR
jgi:hypothetical protein